MGRRAASEEPLGENGWVRGYFFPLEEALAFLCLHPLRPAEPRARASEVPSSATSSSVSSGAYTGTGASASLFQAEKLLL